MTKMTYGEQLRHPNWQRKRLEVLQDARWKCECCDDSTRTLHVHHKRYVKGRMAWEYEREELSALCEECHEQAGEIRDRFLHLLCCVESFPQAGVTESDLLTLCESYLAMAAGGSELGDEHMAPVLGRRRHANTGALAATVFNSDLSDEQIGVLSDIMCGDTAAYGELMQIVVRGGSAARERTEAALEYLRAHSNDKTSGGFTG